ncbi:type I restriction-modification system subunit M [Arcobacter roscoffensis]|uniref:site-specific DNA-methyltransferase (adenine-specific) n=1 Tax=Arcobacter roscoffensis TaxID=2961520 RepID=A0ABY5E357_9BACT|nr:type I restriction-modification system subunit M [Arcobacter roscoffensis]UTJ05590.1 type I restriction-modification system subunit M [Arcobacter roscoffensis]
MSEEQKKILEEKLWAIANILRGKMTADDYKDYILGFIFYKYLSEKIEIFINTDLLGADDFEFANIDESFEDYEELLNDLQKDTVEELGYFLKPNELFSNIAKKGNNESKEESNFILDDLETILKNIESSTMGTGSQEDYENLFEDLDLTSSKLGKSEKQKNELISKVLAKLDEIDFKLQDTKSDVLGDAYEYLIGKFASGAGKTAGEFYTPQEVSTLLAELVTSKRKNIASIYDPTCGSGSLLLRVAKVLPKDQHPKFYGQELTRTTYNLARMNMILHGVHYRDFDIKNEDTLEHPQHKDMQFEAIVANPPFSAHWSARELFLSDDRFSHYGKLAPKTKADFAFVQHMIHHLADNGTMAVVLPHGALYRGNAEAHIRKYMIEDRNYIDAIIGLPANIFFGTPIPTSIMVLKKCRENPNDIMFIYAANEEENCKKENNKQKLLNTAIEEIITTYKARENKDKYSYKASLEEIRKNDYNLNIPRYVDIFEDEEEIKLEEVSAEIEKYENSMNDTDKILQDLCDELEIALPFIRLKDE